jgi:hypothetical protein
VLGLAIRRNAMAIAQHGVLARVVGGQREVEAAVEELH